MTERKRIIATHLEGLPNVSTTVPPTPGVSTHLRVEFNLSAGGKTVCTVVEELRSGDPSIWVRDDADGFLVEASTLEDGEESVVSERLRRALAV